MKVGDECEVGDERVIVGPQMSVAIVSSMRAPGTSLRMEITRIVD